MRMTVACRCLARQEPKVQSISRFNDSCFVLFFKLQCSTSLHQLLEKVKKPAESSLFDMM